MFHKLCRCTPHLGNWTKFLSSVTVLPPSTAEETGHFIAQLSGLIHQLEQLHTALPNYLLPPSARPALDIPATPFLPSCAPSPFYIPPTCPLPPPLPSHHDLTLPKFPSASNSSQLPLGKIINSSHQRSARKQLLPPSFERPQKRKKSHSVH